MKHLALQFYFILQLMSFTALAQDTVAIEEPEPFLFLDYKKNPWFIDVFEPEIIPDIQLRYYPHFDHTFAIEGRVARKWGVELGLGFKFKDEVVILEGRYINNFQPALNGVTYNISANHYYSNKITLGIKGSFRNYGAENIEYRRRDAVSERQSLLRRAIRFEGVLSRRFFIDSRRGFGFGLTAFAAAGVQFQSRSEFIHSYFYRDPTLDASQLPPPHQQTHRFLPLPTLQLGISADLRLLRMYGQRFYNYEP